MAGYKASLREASLGRFAPKRAAHHSLQTQVAQRFKNSALLKLRARIERALPVRTHGCVQRVTRRPAERRQGLGWRRWSMGLMGQCLCPTQSVGPWRDGFAADEQLTWPESPDSELASATPASVWPPGPSLTSSPAWLGCRQAFHWRPSAERSPALGRATSTRWQLLVWSGADIGLRIPVLLLAAAQSPRPARDRTSASRPGPRTASSACVGPH